MICLSFMLRYHQVAFVHAESRREAMRMLRRFRRRIDEACRNDLIIISNEVAFLKRNFVFLRVGEHDEADDEDSEEQPRAKDAAPLDGGAGPLDLTAIERELRNIVSA